jgi:FtsP/CotA-like multicopper oxidase with cupredoxin domain
MRELPSRGRKAVCGIFLLLLLRFSSSCFAQISHFGKPVPSRQPSSSEKSFADLTSPASDPADAVCARSAVGAVVSDPPSISSQNGVLQVTFQYQTTTDKNGLTRYCYVYTNSAGQAQEAPTLEVNPGDQLIIQFNNNLPVASASDTSAHPMQGMKMHPAATGANSDCSATSVTSSSTNLHFHGTNVAPVCGQDEVVHTIIPPQSNFTYTVQIPANEPPGAYWYHPHAHGFSDPQVIGGASGVILVEGIENVNPIVAGLPQRVFVLRDQDLPASESNDSGIPKTDLSINYVPILYPAYTPAVIQTGVSEQEFWRVLNTSADTLLNIQVVDHGVAQPLQIVSVDGVPLTDGNGNPTTSTVTSYVMSPASRIEFIVTTPAVGDATAQLVTQTWDNGPTGDYDPGRPIANIVAVTGSSSATTAKRLPAQTATRHVTRFAALNTTAPVNQRTLYFTVAPDFSAFYITVDGQTPATFNMDGPPNITVTEGTVEQWTIQNRSTMDHNFHIHQLHFQTLAINGTPVTDPTLRDTIVVPHWSGNASDPYPSVTLLMDFRDPNIVGTFVYHCHILSHEDRGMMGMIQILPGATTTTLSASTASVPAGTSVTLTATVAPAAGSGTPTGTVTFLNGSTTLGSGTLNSSGVATLSLTTLPIGSNSITANYSGDTSFASSTATALTVTVVAVASSPGFSPGAGTYGFSQQVTINTSTGGGVIYYTVDGTTPTTASTQYSGPITVFSTETIQAIAAASGYANSIVTSAAYTINTGSNTGLQFVTIAPCRVADTRNPSGPFGGPELSAGTSREVDIPQSACGVPTSAVAYSLNVTVIPDASLAYLTLWPSGQTQPNVSTLNSDGRVKANAAITPAGTNGGVSVYVTDATQVLLDIDGYFVPAGTSSALAFYPVAPCRVADTRNPAGPLGGPFVPGGGSRDFPVQSSNCNLPASALAYSLNVTAVPHTVLSYLTAWPTGQTQPNTSTLNSPTGIAVANAAIVPAGDSGDISIYVSDDADVVLDVNGYFAPPVSGGLSLYPATPCRVLDTRATSGIFSGVLPVAVQASGCAPPSTAQSYVLNATVVPAGPLNYLTLWPDGETQPYVSTLNANDGAVASNLAIVSTMNGSIDAFAYSPTQLIIDISSWFAP